MKMKEAMKIIEGPEDVFMVSFEWRGDGVLTGDHFPDKHAGEELISTEEEAWKLAAEFAKKTVGKAVNIYVVNADFIPVAGWYEKAIENGCRFFIVARDRLEAD